MILMIKSINIIENSALIIIFIDYIIKLRMNFMVI